MKHEGGFHRSRGYEAPVEVTHTKRTQNLSQNG